MKKYIKPDMLINKFAVNEAVAYCDPTQVYNEVTVNCVITSSHKIFYTSTNGSKCDSDYNSMAIVTYNGTAYLVWSESFTVTAGSYNAGSGETLTGMNLLNKLAKATGASSAQGYHAGPINADIESVRNQSA